MALLYKLADVLDLDAGELLTVSKITQTAPGLLAQRAELVHLILHGCYPRHGALDEWDGLLARIHSGEFGDHP